MEQENIRHTTHTLDYIANYSSFDCCVKCKMFKKEIKRKNRFLHSIILTNIDKKLINVNIIANEIVFHRYSHSRKVRRERGQKLNRQKIECFFTPRYLQNVKPKNSNQQKIHTYWMVVETCYLSDVSSHSMEYSTNENPMHILITITQRRGKTYYEAVNNTESKGRKICIEMRRVKNWHI